MCILCLCVYVVCVKVPFSAPEVSYIMQACCPSPPPPALSLLCTGLSSYCFSTGLLQGSGRVSSHTETGREWDEVRTRTHAHTHRKTSPQHLMYSGTCLYWSLYTNTHTHTHTHTQCTLYMFDESLLCCSIPDHSQVHCVRIHTSAGTKLHKQL